MLVLWLLNEVLKVVEPPWKLPETNDGSLLKNNSVILRAFFQRCHLVATVLLCHAHFLEILVLPMIYGL